MNPQETLDKFGLTVESKFIPWLQSRNAGEKDPSLNWKVTLMHNGKKVLTTDYSAGMGHTPAYKKIKNVFKISYDDMRGIKEECEGGYEIRYMPTMDFYSPNKNKPLLPDSCDVIYSLLMDAEAIDYDSFEHWADCFGYDEDSRSAEKIYETCLQFGLKLRNALGEEILSELREAFQDY